MKTVQLFLLLSLLCPSLMMNAQTVDEICQHHVKALGGEQAVNNIKTLKMVQTGTSQGMDMPITSIVIPGKAYYQKIQTSMGYIISSVHGDSGWTYSSSSSRKTTLSPAMTQSMLIQSKFYGPLFDYYVNKKTTEVKNITMAGTTTIDREKCYHLEVYYKSGYKATVYLSSRNYMILKAISPAGTIKYGNYRKVKGVLIPYYIEIFNNQGTIVATTFKIEINGKIDNALFAHP